MVDAWLYVDCSVLTDVIWDIVLLVTFSLPFFHWFDLYLTLPLPPPLPGVPFAMFSNYDGVAGTRTATRMACGSTTSCTITLSECIARLLRGFPSVRGGDKNRGVGVLLFLACESSC